MKSLKKNTYTQKSNNNLILISSLTVLGFLLTPVAIANVNTTVLFRPPPKKEQPESTEGAASRQNRECAQDFLVPRQQESSGDRDSDYRRSRAELTAIVPDSKYGLTVADRPTFWVYLPKTSAQQAILSIKEEGINPHWQQSLSLTPEAGIIGIKLSDDAPALEIGKNYQWAVILVCGSRPNPNDPVVAAWIKRVDEFQLIDSQLSAKTMLDKAAWYAQKGIWYDALDILVAEKKSSLDNWNDIWVKYLQSGGLDEIANEPIISNQ
jgi:hypothetical protein